ncbi:MAG: hypothetical protein LBV28_04765, partial [Puniceicoccales bacterium]|nr:hypothetical protein [Puniceicoccales bacterium]
MRTKDGDLWRAGNGWQIFFPESNGTANKRCNIPSVPLSKDACPAPRLSVQNTHSSLLKMTTKNTQTTAPTTSRRDFVKTMAHASFAAIAAPWIVPIGVVRAQTVPAANGAPAAVRPVPSERVTFALIGSGAQGRDGMAFVLRNPAAQVIGVC